ncbi:MAG: double-cubane-cluster-containing anaerobic reductase [Candidatus Jordarchaeales archaeon]
MSDGYREMWRELGLDLERHDALLASLLPVYQEMYLSQKNRPKSMGYYDFVVSEIHGLRVKELVDFRKKGGKVVSTFCLYVPEELVIAAGAVQVGLCGGANATIEYAERDLPRNLCPLIKSSYGFKISALCPYFAVSDLIVGETTCDGKKKMYEFLGRHAPTYVVEMPHKPSTEQARRLWLEELKLLKAKLEELTGNKVTVEKLRNAVNIVNEKRNVLRKLFEARKARPSPISGKDAILVTQIGFYDDPRRFVEKTGELVRELEERIKNKEGVADEDAPRIIISGCPMAIPNWKLHHIIESSGAVVVAEESCTGSRYLSIGSVNTNAKSVDEFLKAIADAYSNVHCACFTPNDERVSDVVKLVEEFDADGVIHYNLHSCHPYSVEANKVIRALKEEGIPAMSIETDYSKEDVGQLTTRVEAFIEMIKK